MYLEVELEYAGVLGTGKGIWLHLEQKCVSITMDSLLYYCSTIELTDHHSIRILDDIVLYAAMMLEK